MSDVLTKMKTRRSIRKYKPDAVIYRAKEEFETEWGKELLKSLGIEGEYEGIGHCALGYIEGEYPAEPARKENRVYYVK